MKNWDNQTKLFSETVQLRPFNHAKKLTGRRAPPGEQAPNNK